MIFEVFLLIYIYQKNQKLCCGKFCSAEVIPLLMWDYQKAQFLLLIPALH